MPKCPKCGCEMTGGAPHGPWPVQYECRRCNTFVVPTSHDKEPRLTEDEFNSRHRLGRGGM